MAGSFKTPCPSCEADVLVKGANLIGRKIDCPKCKYRFTVPNPDGEGANDGFDVVETPKKKGNPKALVGIILGVIGIAALGIGGYVMFGGKDEPLPVASNPRANLPPRETPKDGPKGGQTRPSPIGKKDTPPPKTPEGPVDPTKVGQGITDPVAPVAKPVENLKPPAVMKDAANLLPQQSVAVMRVSMDRLRTTPFYSAFFDKPMLDFFQSTMTFEASDMESVHLCLVDADRDPFVVIRTKKPISFVEMRQKMDMDLAGISPINGRYDLYEIKTNAFVKALSRVLSSDALKKDAGIPVTEEEKKKEKPLGLHYYDSQTLMIGDLVILGRFLSELDKNNDPPFQTQLIGTPPGAAPAAPETPAPPPAAPAGKGGKGSPRGGNRGGEATPPPAAGTEEHKLFTDKADYRTIRPELKQMLNRLEADPKNLPSLMYVDIVDHRLFEFQDLDEASTADYIAVILKVFFSEIKVIGLSVNQFTKNKIAATMLTQYLVDTDLKKSVEKQIVPLLVLEIKPRIIDLCGTNVAVISQIGDTNAGGGRSGAGRNLIVPGEDLTNNSKISVTHSDLVAAIEFDINPNSEYYNKRIQPGIVSTATQMKGRMAVLSGETSWHSLSTRFARLTDEKKKFPLGTLPRDSNPGRFGLPFPPDQRCSFIVDLLPYLDKGGLRQTIQDKKFGWYDKANLRAAEAWVPQLLVPYYPQTAWRAFSPYAEQGTLALGATNFVALSGLGRDSARYNPNDPKQAKLVGITGYEWGSKPAEITDGMSNTIYMIQVPPGLNRPWIAGGGATVMGVDNEANPISDFVSTEPNGKRGTYALMADGSVRHIPDTIDPAVFKALVTRAGGETIADLEVKAPKIPVPKGMETELKGSSGEVGKKPGKPKPDRSKIDVAELQKIQGKWNVTYMFREGKAMPPADLEQLELSVTFDDTNMTIAATGAGGTTVSILLLDPKANPKQITFQSAEEAANNLATLGIYSLEGKKLRIRYSKNATPDKLPKFLKAPDADAGENESYMELTKAE